MYRKGNIVNLGETRQLTSEKTGQTMTLTKITVYWIESVNQRQEPDEVTLTGEMFGEYDLARIRQAIDAHEQVDFSVYFNVSTSKDGRSFNNIRIYLPKSWRKNA